MSGVNIWTQKGLQCKGKAIVIDPKNKKFEQKKKLFKTLIQGKFKVLHIIQIQIETVKEIKAPSYLFIKETTEQSQLEAAKMRYRALFVEQKE